MAFSRKVVVARSLAEKHRSSLIRTNDDRLLRKLKRDKMMTQKGQKPVFESIEGLDTGHGKNVNRRDRTR